MFGMNDVAETDPDGPEPSGAVRFRAIFLSDLHLGSRGCRAGEAADFLKATECEDLYLVGDVVDVWALRRAWHWNADHDRVVKHLLRKGRRGTRITYVPGNHDEMLRDWLPETLGNRGEGHVGVSGMALRGRAEHALLDGRRLLVLHGDEFDSVVRRLPWLAHLGDRAYDAAIRANRWLAAARRRMGLPYWSLSAWLKSRVKEATKAIDRFEDAVLREAASVGAAGAVCGHIHTPALRRQAGMVYGNCGDWVENCSALAERLDGCLVLLLWRDGRVIEVAKTPPQSPTVRV